jgi:hypothetical protein
MNKILITDFKCSMKTLFTVCFTVVLLGVRLKGQDFVGSSLSISGHSQLNTVQAGNFHLSGSLEMGSTDLLGSTAPSDYIYGVPSFNIIVGSSPSSWGDQDPVTFNYDANYGSGIMEFRSTHSNATFQWTSVNGEPNLNSLNTLMTLSNGSLTVPQINVVSLNATNLNVGGSPLPPFANYFPPGESPSRMVWGASATGTTDNAISIGAGSKSKEGISIGQNALSGDVVGNDSALNLHQKSLWVGGIRSVAIGPAAFAGASSTAIGYSAAARLDGLAVGQNSQAFGQSAIAIGRDVVSIGDNAVTLGLGLKSYDMGMVAVGSYNSDSSPGGSIDQRRLNHYSNAVAFVVGIGSGDSERANGFIVRRSGLVEVTGELSVEGTTFVEDAEVTGTLILVNPAGGISVAEEFGGPPSGN